MDVLLPGGVNLGSRVNSEGLLSEGEMRSQVEDGLEIHGQIGEDLEPWRRGGTVAP